jgi:hypothetical protein
MPIIPIPSVSSPSADVRSRVYVPVRPQRLLALVSLWALAGASGTACTAANPDFAPATGVKAGEAGAEPNAPDLGSEMVVDSAPPDDVNTKIDAVTPGADAATPTTDAAAPTMDATTPTMDAAAPTMDATTPTTDGATPTMDAPTAAGLLAGWAFNQPPAMGSTTLVDSFGNTASLKGSITWANDHPPSVGAGQSLLFNGAASYVVLTLAASQRPTSTAPKTVALWFKGTDPGPDTRTLIALSNQNKASDVGLELGVGATKIEGWPFGRSYRPLSMTTPTPRNVWHHVAYTFDGGTHLLYVDGLECARSTWAAKAGVLDTVKLGTSDDASVPAFFQGLLCDVRIYGRPLGAAEIRGLAGLPP